MSSAKGRKAGCKRKEVMKSCVSRITACASLVLFMLLIARGDVCCASLKSGQCNIVLITIDTLRADHLSCYGYHRKTSPYIDSLAAGGIACTNAYAPSSWTTPSMASLFTSVYPINHGVINGIGLKMDQAIYVQNIFSPDLKTLAEVLQAHGYTTFGVSSHRNLDERFGFARGFDYFTCLPFLPAQAVNEAVLAREAALKQAEKFFLWIHYFDPHAPYTAQKPWAREYALEAQTEVLLDLPALSGAELARLLQKCPDGGLPDATQPLCGYLKQLRQNYNDNVINPQDHDIALYDSEISYVDNHIGMLMKRLNLSDDTLIVITSDHGEEFLEHGEMGHGHNLYQQTIHIPLIMKLPHRQEGTILNQPISLLDVMPTILDISAVSPPSSLLGKSFRNEQKLLFWLKKKMPVSDIDYIYSEIDTSRTLRAIVAPPWKYIYNCKDAAGRLYNIVSDPLEKNDRGCNKTRERDRLRDHLLRWMETAKRYPTTTCDYELSAEDKNKLKGLGYLQ